MNKQRVLQQVRFQTASKNYYHSQINLVCFDWLIFMQINSENKRQLQINGTINALSMRICS